MDSSEWFLAVKGEKLGPVSRKELEEFARLGGLDPRADMVWKEGMADWLPAGEIEGLFERCAPDEVEESPGMAATADSAAPEVWGNEVEDPYFHHDLTEPWPGVGRGGYFLGTMVLPAAGNILLTVLATLAASMLSAEIVQYLPFLGIGFAIIAIYVTVMRFPNLGMSRWWTLGFFVPVLGWWLGYRCFACPPGYALTKKLDTLGWILAILYWLTLAMIMVGTVVLLVLILKGGFDLEAFLRALEQPSGGES